MNPRLKLTEIDQAVRSGSHGADAHDLNVASRRSPAKISYYRSMIGRIFSDKWAQKAPVHWLDVGCGYGELLEAIQQLAPPGSMAEGYEPMAPKAESARQRGLLVTQDYFRKERSPVDVISLVDVFSHVPDFHTLLTEIRGALRPSGEVFIETGNLSDIADRSEFPGELGLPDHLVFAGARHLQGYLERAGFRIVSLEGRRIDGFLNFSKVLAKRMLGRPQVLRMPYTSGYRQLLVRAKLH